MVYIERRKRNKQVYLYLCEKYRKRVPIEDEAGNVTGSRSVVRTKTIAYVGRARDHPALEATIRNRRGMDAAQKQATIAKAYEIIEQRNRFYEMLERLPKGKRDEALAARFRRVKKKPKKRKQGWTAWRRRKRAQRRAERAALTAEDLEPSGPKRDRGGRYLPRKPRTRDGIPIDEVGERGDGPERGTHHNPTPDSSPRRRGPPTSPS